MNFKKVQKFAAIAIASVSLATAQAAQAAETFQVNGGYALNTNNNFRLIDGNPRMSLYQHNINDPDQQFDRLSGNLGGILLRHASTGKCLNAHYLSNNSEINVWPCNPSDPDQNWNLLSLPSGEFLIRRNGTNFCVDSPTRTNTGRVHLITCDPNNANQRWKSTATGSNQSRILQRAKAWVDARVPYNQKASYGSPAYRTDCSGFISMAWELGTSFVTGNLPYTAVNSADDLLPGDAINNKQVGDLGHVVMFVQWSGNWNQGKRKFVAYEENGSYGAVQTTLTLEKYGNAWNIPEYPNHAPWYLQRKR